MIGQTRTDIIAIAAFPVMGVVLEKAGLVTVLWVTPVLLGCLLAIAVAIVRVSPLTNPCSNLLLEDEIKRRELFNRTPRARPPLQAANPLALYPWARSRAEAMAYAHSPFDYDRLGQLGHSKPITPKSSCFMVEISAQCTATGLWGCSTHGGIVHKSTCRFGVIRCEDAPVLAVQTPHLGPLHHPYPWTKQQADDICTPRRVSPDSDLCVCGRDFIACVDATPRERVVLPRLQRAIKAMTPRG
jgi:hypothetical protein